MGNAQSNVDQNKPNKKTLSQIIDYVATNYILTQNFKDMEKLTDTEYCNNLVILTSKIVDQKLSNLEINYLTQRLKGNSEVNEMDSDKLIYFKKDAIDKFDVQNVQNATQKRRMCIGIAKFYVKVAQVFSAIVTTINPTYKFKDLSGNTQQVDLKQKENIPDDAKASIERINMCSQRINALINGQTFTPNQKEPLKINPKFCDINTDSKTGKSRNLYSEPGMPELEKLYFDKYDYDHGGFVGMTENMRKTVYEKDVETLYKAFTGNDKIPLDEKGEKTIKTFTQIPLRNYKNSEGCNPGGKYTKAYEGTIKEKLFFEYASHVNDMMNHVNTNQDKLLQIIDRLFSFNVNPLTKTKEIVVKASLNEKKLEEIVVETRTIIQELYTNCELDFLKGLKIFENIINKTINDTTLIQIKKLEETRDVILTQVDLDKIKEDKPGPAPAALAATTAALVPGPASGTATLVPATPAPAVSATPALVPVTLVPAVSATPALVPVTLVPATLVPATLAEPATNVQKLTYIPSASPSPSPSGPVPATPASASALSATPASASPALASASPALAKPLPALKENIAGTPPPRSLNEPEVFPVYLKEAGGDGNCFFNSIYDSANEQKLLEKIYNTYKPETNPIDKKTFVTYIRGLVAKKLSMEDEGLKTAYEVLENSGIKNKIKLEEDKKYIVDDFQPWLIELYKNSKDFADFKEKVITIIKSSNNYIQGLEYGVTEDLLEDAGIAIESHRFNNTECKESAIKKLNKFDSKGIPVIHLLNETSAKGHFKYFSFIEQAAQAVAVTQAPAPVAVQQAQAQAAPAVTQAPVVQAVQQVQSLPSGDEKKWWKVWKGGKKTKRKHKIFIKHKKIIKHTKKRRG